ncbi:MAG: methionyl-tRNA formyltransferase [Candidatus Omnitrophica bacterium]|nr:methionyl-tRNA formyltransferase [Candidatus Omnitrophota bacterium]
MKVVFFGSSDFAVAALCSLIAHHDVAAVYTQPDRPKGRHLHLSETPVKQFARERGLPVVACPAVGAPDAVAQLRAFQADVFAVVSFGQFLSREVLAIPRFCCLNVHASLLPRWRGAAPVNYALWHGDRETGVTVMRMNEYMDRGDILLQKMTPIAPADDAVGLLARLATLGAEALLESLGMLAGNWAVFSPQDSALATVAPRLKKEDGAIRWEESAAAIHNRVRALVPWPCAYTCLRGIFLKILKTNLVTCAVPSGSQGAPGTILGICKYQGLTVATGQGNILIQTIQPAGRRAMNAYDFVLGHQVRSGDMFGALP